MPKDQTQTLLDDLLHPVRMRILMALAGSPGLTPLQLGEHLNDVAQATLYRQISRLLKAGILVVAEERPVRGTLEKVYALNRDARTKLSQADIAGLSKADHLRYFTSFTVSLIDEFSRYLNQTETVDMAADGVGYTQIVLALSDAEFADFARALNQALLPFVSNEAAPERKKRIFTTILMPEVSGKKGI